jgi:hypothetical protein
MIVIVMQVIYPVFEILFMAIKATLFVMQPIPIVRKQDTLRIEQCILLCEL